MPPEEEGGRGRTTFGCVFHQPQHFLNVLKSREESSRETRGAWSDLRPEKPCGAFERRRGNQLGMCPQWTDALYGQLIPPRPHQPTTPPFDNFGIKTDGKRRASRGPKEVGLAGFWPIKQRLHQTASSELTSTSKLTNKQRGRERKSAHETSLICCLLASSQKAKPKLTK